jgi:hypothetical protein
LSIAKDVSLYSSIQPACKNDSFTVRRCQGLQPRYVVSVAIAGNHQLPVQTGLVSRDGDKSLDQRLQVFFRVQTAERKDIRTITDPDAFQQAA